MRTGEGWREQRRRIERCPEAVHSAVATKSSEAESVGHVQ